MILQALHDLYDRLKDDPSYQVPPPGYSRQKITFKVVITPAGELFQIQDARQIDKGRPRPVQILVPGNNKSPGDVIDPCFLWDNAKYLLGSVDESKASEKVKQRTQRAFHAFRERHLELEGEIDCAGFFAVCRFLENWEPSLAREYPILVDAASTGFGVFQIQGTRGYVHEDATVESWWKQHPLAESDAVRAQCLVTGEMAPIARVHRRVRGVLGAQGTGAAIVGFNASAYESYGKTQSYNAPISESAAFEYVTALNALLDGPKRWKHSLRIGDATVGFWTGRPTVTEDIFLAFASEGSAVHTEGPLEDEGLRAKLVAFLEALRQGREAYGQLEDDPDGTEFFLLGLSPNVARISVRFFHNGTIAELLDNLRKHHRDIGLEGAGDREFPPIWQFLRQTAREAKDIPPLLAAPLLRSIVTGAPYPQGLYSAVLRRIRADRNIGNLRAAIIKGYLNRNLNQEVSMSLDAERRDPAYRMGRLFAALEKTQEDAHDGRLEKTIRDSFYGAASATPRAVFPRLLRTYQHHLAKLEGGRKVNREKLVQSIFDPLSDLPAHLDLAGQGLFAVGYYHQRQDFFIPGGHSGDATTL